MNKLILFALSFIVLFSVFVFAQIDADTITKSGAVCGNKVREPFESCDLSSNASDKDLCHQIGKVAGIAMVCREELCSCLPRKYIVCGDKHTTGNEMCEANDKDFCPKVSELLGAKVECNAKSCLCKATTDALFEVKTAEPTVNLTKSLCGNRNVDDKEECDPPGRMCTFEKTVGICSESCECKELNDIDAESSNSTNSSANVSSVEKTNVSESNASTQANDEEFKKSIDEISPKVDSGVSDTTYTVLLIVLVVLFILALAIGSFFIYKRSQIGDLSEANDSSGGDNANP